MTDGTPLNNGITPPQQARLWLSDCLVLDTETTGLDEYAEIVEISIIDQDGRVVLDTLIKPVNPIPAEVTAIHGITNEMVVNAPSWDAIHEQVLALLTSKPVVIYNAHYDLRMLAQTAKLYGLRDSLIGVSAGCAMLAYAEFFGDRDDFRGGFRWQRLGNAARQQGVVIDGQAHRALSDVKTTLGILKAMAGDAE